MSGVSRSPRQPGIPARLGSYRPLLAVILIILLVGPAAADLVRDGEPDSADDPVAVFQAIREAWVQEDQERLAELVHHDGLQVNNPESANRYVSYSPSQSFYYFRNLFLTHDTDAFILSRVQETGDAPRIHALAMWHRHRTGSDREETLRLMIVLTREDDGWGLAEINTIR